MLRKHAIVVATALALLAQQGVALAQSKDIYSANFIIRGCRSHLANDARDLLTATLDGHCAGVVTTIYFFKTTHFGICAPRGANVGQAIRVVVNYIDQRPQRMHENFMLLALEALQQAWPCRR
jgi:Rap1a immunity proteins